MASGSFGVSTSNGYISGHLDWSSTTDVNSNSSTVTATLYLSRTNSGYTTWGTGSFTININGNQHTNTFNYSITQNSNTVMCSHSVVVGHNADGSKAITISWSGSGNSPFTINSSSGTATLDTIPRASQPSLSAATADMGATITIYTNRVSSNFTHTITYGFGSTSGTIATGVGASCTWTIPLSLANQIPNETVGWGNIHCKTYNGGTLIGEKVVRFDANVPASVVPNFTTITHSENVANINTIVGGYVQKLSKLNLAITGAAGTYSSTIKSYQITFDGETYNSSSAVSDVIKGSGTLTITGKITDSRGRTLSKSVTVTVLAYDYPKITYIGLSRCDSDGTLNDLGLYVKVTTRGSCSSLMVGGVEKNTRYNKILSKLRTVTTWTTAKEFSSGNNLIMDMYNIVGTYDAAISYDFRFALTDQFSTTITQYVLSSGVVPLSLGKDGIGVGKVWEQGALDVAGHFYISKGAIHTRLDTTAANGGGLNMHNSDILAANAIYFNDVAAAGEGIFFLKTGATIGSTNVADYDEFRISNGTAFMNGEEVFSSDEKVLWEGAYYMNENQTITPSKAITSCPNGWIIVWCDYDAATSTVNNWDLNYFVIPKDRIGTGTWHVICANGGTTVTKYIYVNATTIVGYSTNDDNTTLTDVVLRRVYSF